MIIELTLAAVISCRLICKLYLVVYLGYICLLSLPHRPADKMRGEN